MRKDQILDMLSYKRPAGSKTESMFIRQYVDVLPGAKKDKAGNRIVRVGADPDILWSCHTDTVHREAGFTMPEFNGAIVSAPGQILGADDCAGVWLLREMILAGKPGLYIFHRGEEIGGIGSDHIARNNPKLLKGVKAAIALDRAGRTDIITHMGERVCSDVFADSLQYELGIKSLAPCDGGLFTDTLNYVGLARECSNISVGYANAHSDKESLDTDYLQELLAALLALDTNALETPGFEPDPRYGYLRPEGSIDADLVEFIRRNPEITAQMLIDYGIESEIYQY